MATYMFERSEGNISEGNVKEIIRQAGVNTGNPDVYNPALYSYDTQGTHRVDATGPGDMSPPALEHAARSDLGLKGTTVGFLPDSAFDALGSPGSLVGAFGPLTPTIGNMLGATDYGVTVTMNQNTVTALSTGGYSLYGFKGVRSSTGGGAPLVWFKTLSFGLNTDVSWKIQYEAYTSRSQIIPNGQITGMNSYAANLGQRLEVTSPQGTGDVVAGTGGAISIENLTTQQFSCGISEVVNGAASPLCAFPLYGNGLDAMVPIQKVMLTFATDTVNTGTVIEKAYSQSVLVDLTSSTRRTVSFDINTGWNWGGGAWGQAIRPNTNIVPLLIETSASF